MIDSDELIGVARLLASGAEANDAALRRAVSTAYYALFHALAAFAADRLIAPAAASSAYAMVYRGIDHKKIKDVLENVAKPNIKLAIRKALKREDVSDELRKFAGVFVTIQQLRHVADYDPTTIWSKTDVNDLIDEVDDALQSFRKLDPAELTDIVVYALLGARAS